MFPHFLLAFKHLLLFQPIRTILFNYLLFFSFPLQKVDHVFSLKSVPLIKNTSLLLFLLHLQKLLLCKTNVLCVASERYVFKERTHFTACRAPLKHILLLQLLIKGKQISFWLSRIRRRRSHRTSTHWPINATCYLRKNTLCVCSRSSTGLDLRSCAEFLRIWPFIFALNFLRILSAFDWRFTCLISVVSWVFVCDR